MASAKTMGFKQLAIAGSLVANVVMGGALLYVQGQVKVRDAINFVPNGTTTGALLQVNGVTEDQIWSVPCSATGGNVKTSYDGTTGTGAKYNTCLSAMPFTTTGALTYINLSCGSVPKALAGDLSIVKGRVAGSGVSLRNFGDITLGTGATFNFGTGVTMVAPSDFVKFNTLTTPGSAVDCKLRLRGFDKYGN